MSSLLKVSYLEKIDVLIIIGIFLLLPLVFSLSLVTEFMVFSIFVLSYNLLYGYMGRLSVGHMLFLGSGAYGASMCVAYISANPIIAIFFGILLGFLVSLIIGPIVVRTSGAAFALINMAFNQIGFFLIQTGLAKWTGGADGKSAYFDSIGPINFNKPKVVYFLSMIVLIMSFVFMKKLTKSPFGILIKTIKEKELRSKFLGYNVFKAKLITYVISCSMAALAGALYTINFAYVTPSFISPTRNIEVIFATLVGGVGNIYGSIVGGTLYILISTYLPNLVQRWEMILGILLLFVVFKFKRGITGFIQILIKRRTRSSLPKEGTV